MTPADQILERAINDTVLHLQCTQDMDARREVGELMRRLIAMRSADYVAEMERQKGIASGG